MLVARAAALVTSDFAFFVLPPMGHRGPAGAPMSDRAQPAGFIRTSARAGARDGRVRIDRASANHELPLLDSSNRKEGRLMHPITALMLSRSHRGGTAPRDVASAPLAERGAGRSRRASRSWIDAIRLAGILRPSGSTEGVTAPARRTTVRLLAPPGAPHGCRGSTPAAVPGLSSAGDATDPHRHPRRGPHGRPGRPPGDRRSRPARSMAGPGRRRRDRGGDVAASAGAARRSVPAARQGPGARGLRAARPIGPAGAPRRPARDERPSAVRGDGPRRPGAADRGDAGQGRPPAARRTLGRTSAA